MNLLKRFSLGILFAASAVVLVTACDEHRSFKPIKPGSKVSAEDCRAVNCAPGGPITPDFAPSNDPSIAQDALSELKSLAQQVNEEVKLNLTSADAQAIQAIDVKVTKSNDNEKYNLSINAILNMGLEEGQLIDLSVNDIQITPGKTFRVNTIVQDLSVIDENQNFPIIGKVFNPKSEKLSDVRQAELSASNQEALPLINLVSLISCSTNCESVLIFVQVKVLDTEDANGALIVINNETREFNSKDLISTVRYTSLGEASKSIAQREIELNEINSDAQINNMIAEEEEAAAERLALEKAAEEAAGTDADSNEEADSDMEAQRLKDLKTANELEDMKG